MTIGIYKLSFTGTDEVYIGQSVNIEIRYKEHLISLKAGKANQKMQKAYQAYGIPIMQQLLECSIAELDCAEQEAIDIYDSIRKGLNILLPGTTPILKGDTNGFSKYTNAQYYQVLILLGAVPGIPYTQIAERTGVSRCVVSSISNLVSHSWLSEMYPLDYLKIVEIKYSTGRNCAIMQGAHLPRVVSPLGEIFAVENISEFARVHGLIQIGLSSLLRGKTRVHKGWALEGTVAIPNHPALINTSGDIFCIPHKGMAKFARQNRLHVHNLHSMFQDSTKRFKGWRLATEEEVANSIEKINLHNKAEASIIVS